MKKVIRVVLILILCIAVFIGGFALFVQMRGIPTYEAIDPGTQVVGDSNMVKEGARLASMLCVHCHYNPGTNAMTGMYRPDVADFGKIYSSNITQDKEYGIGNYTDGQLLYLLRTGVKPDGSYMPPYMPKFTHMSDKDLQGIVAWLRSDDPRLTPKAIPDTASEPNFLAKFLCTVAFKPLTYPDKPIFPPDTADKIAFGKYMVTAKVECYACHSKSFETINVEFPEKTEGYMAGGNKIPDLSGKRIISSNLTPDEKTGIGSWTEDQFVRAVKYGNRPDGTSNREPMIPFVNMTDLEARAIFAYLSSLTPVSHKIERTLTH